MKLIDRKYTEVKKLHKKFSGNLDDVVIYDVEDIFGLSNIPVEESDVIKLLEELKTITDIKNHLIGKNRNISELSENELRRIQFISLYFQNEFIQSSLYPTRDIIQFLLGGKIINIPKKYYGQYIKPTSFKIDEFGYRDDGEGRIVQDESSKIRGYILYSHGLIFIQTTDSINELSFESTITINTLHVHAKALNHEFNYSLNPTSIKKFTEKVNIAPYITSLGLYNDSDQLLAVAKFSTPIKKSLDTDMSFEVKIDV